MTDLDAIARAAFDAWADARQYTPAFRAHMRRHWVAGFAEGLAAGVELAKPKRRRRVEDGER